MQEGQRPRLAPASVFDVAEYILKKMGPMSAMKLQKLVYYCQAWSLVWDEQPLFSEAIEAWREGPVVRPLFNRHRGQYVVQEGGMGGNLTALDSVQQDTMDAVLDAYGRMTGDDLSALSHGEAPWRQARDDLTDNDPSSRTIDLSDVRNFYASLEAAPVGGSGRFYLKSLLARVTSENVHAEIPTGHAVGREA